MDVVETAGRGVRRAAGPGAAVKRARETRGDVAALAGAEPGGKPGTKSGAAPGAKAGPAEKAAAVPPRKQVPAPDGAAAAVRLGWRSWWEVSRATAKAFRRDELLDRAAALTYYGVLSIFPALLVVVSLLGIAGRSVTNRILDNLTKATPSSARDVVANGVRHLQNTGGTGSLLAVVGVLGALWSASGYVGAFIRASDVVYGMPDRRPLWKAGPLRLAVTLVLVVLAVASATIVVFTGALARQTATALGLGHAELLVWSIAKWPALVVLVGAMIAILYRAAPHAALHGFRWATPGSLLALVVWMIASGGFAAYVANFPSYNRTYGTLAAAAIFLVWLWLTNLAVLLGLEFDAEVQRERAALAALPDV